MNARRDKAKEHRRKVDHQVEPPVVEEYSVRTDPLALESGKFCLDVAKLVFI